MRALARSELSFSRSEFDILETLVRKAETPVSREDLLAKIDAGEESSDRAIDVHVSRIRSQLRKAGTGGLVISPVYGVGYKLERSSK